MAIKKIEMIPESTNDYGDILYPRTSVDIVDGIDRYGIASGTNAYIVTIPNTPILYDGLTIRVKFPNASTGATSININGLGAKSIIKAGGGSPNIKANGVYSLVYDGTNFQLQGEGGEYGTAQAGDVLSGKTIGTDDGLVSGTIPIAINVSPYEKSSELYVGASGVTYMKTQGNKYFNNGTWLQFTEPNLIASNIRSGVTIGSTTKITGTAPIPSGNAVVSNVLATKTFSNGSSVGLTGTMPNRGTVTNTLTTQGGSYTIPSGYHSGSGKVTASFANLVAGNVKSGVNIGGVVGSLVQGKRFASGNIGTLTSDRVINCGFKPRFVSITHDDNYTQNMCYFHDFGVPDTMRPNFLLIDGGKVYAYNQTSTGFTLKRMTTGYTCLNTRWYAVEE